jgi:hypothetical protein
MSSLLSYHALTLISINFGNSEGPEVGIAMRMSNGIQREALNSETIIYGVNIENTGTLKKLRASMQHLNKFKHF